MGPLVELTLSQPQPIIDAMTAAGTSIPSPMRVVAMIDTGATGSVMQKGLAAQLGLQPVGVVYISTPSSANVPCNEYAVRFLFPNNVVVDGTMIEAPMQGQGQVQALIGRDTLAHGVLVYIGYANLFSLSF